MSSSAPPKHVPVTGTPPEAAAGGTGTLDYDQLYGHVVHLAESLPVRHRQLLHERLGASLTTVPLRLGVQEPVVVAAQPVPSAPNPTPSVLSPCLTESYDGQRGQGTSTTPVSRAPPPNLKNCDNVPAHAQQPHLCTSDESQRSAPWIRRFVARLFDVGVVLVLLPRPLKRRPLFILGSVAMDILWHTRSPGQTLGKRLLGLQVVESSSHSSANAPSSSHRLAKISRNNLVAAAMFRSALLHSLLYLAFEHYGRIQLQWNFWSRVLLLSAATGFFGTSNDRRCLHDHIFGTRVVVYNSRLH
jgi:uncharacterized RDD family membrane protein YckC